MTAKNPFVLAPEEYQRDLNPIGHSVNDYVFFLHTSTGKPVEECKAFVNASLRPGGQFAFQDRKIVYLERGENGDRVEKEGKLLDFLMESISNKELIAPNLTTYVNPAVNQSLLVEFVDENVAARSRAKKAMFKAKRDGDSFLQTLKKTEQGNKKIANNSISGAHVSSSTPLYNKTSHSTLTSNCRSTSGFGNANNEKLLCGNRHYWNAKITLNNIVSIVNHTDYVQFDKMVQQYGLVLPTVDDMMTCITYSTNQYWRNEQSLAFLRQYAEKLSPLQRAAFVYTGDLFQLARLNPAMMSTFINRLAYPVKEKCDDCNKVMTEMRPEYVTLAASLFYSEMKKHIPEDKDAINASGIRGTELEHWVCSSALNIHHTLEDYRLFIEAIFVTENVPASLAFFPESIRKAALTSDTDSTIFTVQDWVFWLFGQNAPFNDATYGVEAVMIFLAAESITHVLARMSANFGIETKRIHQVAMKNEFKFDVFIPTQVGKHYFAYISQQEGDINRHFEEEIKGVHLKSSNVPTVIMDQAKAMMLEIMDTVVEGKKLSVRKLLTTVADIERDIKRSMLAGESTFFRNAQVKSSNSYTKSEELSPYQNYLMWEEVFAPKYGHAPPPPYACSKVCLTLKSAKVIKDWIDSLEDKALAGRLSKWMEANNKASILSFLMPQDMLRSVGMPAELVPIIDMRKSILDNTGVFYIILEATGIYMNNKKMTRLAMEEY